MTDDELAEMALATVSIQVAPARAERELLQRPPWYRRLVCLVRWHVTDFTRLPEVWCLRCGSQL